MYLKFSPVSPIYCASGIFGNELNTPRSRITVIIAWLNSHVINENLSSSVNVFASFASMFATRFVAFIISNSIPD